MLEYVDLPVWRGKEYRAYRATGPDADAVLSGRYLYLADGWQVQIEGRDDICELAGLSWPWDVLPQPVWNELHESGELEKHGWGVWHYPPGDHFGGPRFGDELEKLAINTLASLLSESLDKVVVYRP